MSKFINNQQVYTFDELSTNAQEKAISYEYENYPNHLIQEDLTRIAESLIHDMLPHAKFEDQIFYDLSYSQGSGAVICFSYDDFNQFIADFPECIRYIRSKLSELNLEKELENIEFSFTCNSNSRYCFEELSYNIQDYNDDTSKFVNYLDEYLYQETSTRGGQSNGDVSYKIHDLQREFTQQAYHYIEHLFDDPDYWDNMWFDNAGNYVGTNEDLNI